MISPKVGVPENKKYYNDHQNAIFSMVLVSLR